MVTHLHSVVFYRYILHSSLLLAIKGNVIEKTNYLDFFPKLKFSTQSRIQSRMNGNQGDQIFHLIGDSLLRVVILKITQTALIFGLLVPRLRLHMQFFDKKCVGYSLGVFFTNYFGHPDGNPFMYSVVFYRY
jgi:hypothetical protein